MPSEPSRPPVIDFHGHLLVQDVWERNSAHNVSTGFGARPAVPPPGTGLAQALPKLLDPELHLVDMDQLGIDRELLLSITVMQGSSWAPAQDDLRDCARVNDVIGKWVARHPERFIASATVPLQDLGLAVPELRRAASDLGAQVVQVPAQVRGVYLGHPSLRVFWEAVAELGLIALVHPEGTTDPWFQEYSLWNSIGQGIEEARALSSMIYEGLLEALPELRIVVAHGGGFLPHYFGRLDRNVTNMPQTARHLSRLPSSYLADLYYDTCVYDSSVLEVLIGRYGADHMVMGADYPVGEADPLGFVRSAPALSGAQQAAILGGTAARLLGR